MGQETGIAWTNHTANFWWGCQRVSPGCEKCYAEVLATTRRKLKVWGPPSTTVRRRMKGIWQDVPKWNATAQRDGVRRRMFVSSMADIFEDHPQVAPWRAEALALLERCTSLDVQLLTKRPENILRMVPPSWLTSWPAHVWVGCTVEDQKRAEQRIPHLLRVPARVRFLSCEPLLEGVNLNSFWDDDGALLFPLERTRAEKLPPPYAGSRVTNHPGIGWVIVGGESGHGARSFDVEWARDIVAQCKAANVPVFVKQYGDNPVETVEECPTGGACGLDECAMGCRYKTASTRRVKLTAHHGADPTEWPPELRVQEFPRVSP